MLIKKDLKTFATMCKLSRIVKNETPRKRLSVPPKSATYDFQY